MFDTTELRAALAEVRVAVERAAAEKWGTVVDISDPEISGAYFKHVREAGNDALMQLGELGGATHVLLFCELVTPARSALQAIDDSSDQTQDGSHAFKVDVVHGDPGGLVNVASWEIRVAGTLDFDGDGK